MRHWRSQGAVRAFHGTRDARWCAAGAATTPSSIRLVRHGICALVHRGSCCSCDPLTSPFAWCSICSGRRLPATAPGAGRMDGRADHRGLWRACLTTFACPAGTRHAAGGGRAAAGRMRSWAGGGGRGSGEALQLPLPRDCSCDCRHGPTDSLRLRDGYPQPRRHARFRGARVVACQAAAPLFTW